MVKSCRILTTSTLLALAFGLSCSSEEEGADDSNGSEPHGQEFRDINNDGVPDPLTAGEFGAAGVAVTEADLNAMRDAACTGWVAERFVQR